MVLKKCILILVFTAAFTTITEAQLHSLGRAGKSLIDEATGAISSGFHNLGGVIRQLFSGFNQRSPTGRPGLNILPNSQFHPGVLAQGSNPRPPSGSENKWSDLNQGIIQGNNLVGIQRQQPDQPRPGSLNFNWQTVPNEGQLSKQPQDLADILNVQNKNGLQSDIYNGEQKGTNRFQRSAFVFPQDSEESGLGGQKENVPSSHGGGRLYEGTLDDFFLTEATVDRPTSGGNLGGTGKDVVVPTPTISNDRIVFEDDGETPYQKQCVQNCPTTSEYNPVCGTDGVTYFNPGRLVCARNCGIYVRQRSRGSCNKAGR